MTAVSVEGRVARRRRSAREQILEATWALAGERGWDGFSLKDLGAAVGMQAPSLYSYFSGKPEILDALFADGYRRMDEVLEAQVGLIPSVADVRTRLVVVLTTWIRFCQENPARYRLMFTSAVPHWRPSEESYAASLASYRRMAEYLEPLGIAPGPRLDALTAIMSGLAAQQLANDPQGERWIALVPYVIDMFLAQLERIPEAMP